MGIKNHSQAGLHGTGFKMFKLNINKNSVKACLNKFEFAKFKASEEFGGAMEEAVLLTQTNIELRTPVDTDNLRGKIAGQTLRGGSAGTVIRGIVSDNAIYGEAVEKGSKPHFPPIAAIEGWAKRHGANPYLVARAISKRGTKARHMFRDGLAESKAGIFAIFMTRGKEFLQKIGR